MSDTEIPSSPKEPPSTETSHSMEEVIASIRVAIAPHATVEARAAGASACRTILTVLAAQPGEPLAGQGPPRSAPRGQLVDVVKELVTSQSSPIDGMLAQLAAMPREQILAWLNERLRALAPAGAPTAPTAPRTAAPRFHLIPVPQVRRPGER